MHQTHFTVFDLFAGIGGFRLGVHKHGGHCIGFSEINKTAIDTYCDNFKVTKSSNLGDITNINTLPPHDLLTAGVPCQSWSIAGNNLGFHDTRGQLWEDTIRLLQQSQPQVFIFENVKGLTENRHRKAFLHIQEQIKQAGYYAHYLVINSTDYGVPQNRVRLYIVGFKELTYKHKFILPTPSTKNHTLGDILDEDLPLDWQNHFLSMQTADRQNMKMSHRECFYFNDLRNGKDTIHTWDIIKTTQRQKNICLLHLQHRRKKQYGSQDGNPLSLQQLQKLDPTIQQNELDELIQLGILKPIEYCFLINRNINTDLSNNEQLLLSFNNNNIIIPNDIKNKTSYKIQHINTQKTIQSLKEKQIITCIELRYEFLNTKISTGLFGIQRVYFRTANAFSTLTAQDTNDFITLKILQSSASKQDFIDQIYTPQAFRRISRTEACRLQGFPTDYKLPTSRSQWMALLGNSVTVSVIDILCEAVCRTGVFVK